MKYWVIPCNLKIFRVTDYFNENDVVDWKQSHYKFETGDIVFIYIGLPYSSIRYMLEVVKCDVPYEDTFDAKSYWTDEHLKEELLRDYKYVRLKLLKSVNTDELSLERLSAFGFKAPQGATYRLSSNLIEHINRCF